MIGLFDTHSHLNDNSFAHNIKDVLADAAENGVDRVICPGYDMPSSRRAIEIAEEFDNVWATVGVHPHDATTVTLESLAEISRLSEHPRVVAIGEIGLDFFRDLSPRLVQEDAFRAQLELAKELNMPVVVHDRDAGTEIMHVIDDVGLPSAGGVLHCFSEDTDYALRAVELGFYIGIGGRVTFGKTNKLHDVVRAVPLDRLLIETDAPYLTPEPFRGRRRNEPAYVRYVAEKIADLRQIDVDQIARITSENAVRLFQRLEIA